jgi:hypothetical protein
MIRRLFFFVLILGALLTACTDEDSFSTSRGNLLSFSVDTVRMDTLFSTVPSATYTFWVKNNADDGIRIQTARLERGGQSGFRVNVDGSYLDPVASNFEVRKGDSLLVFVEVTTRENGQNGPQLVEDNLVFTLESGVVQKMNLRTWSWDAEKIGTLHVERDTVIESSRPIIVYDSIVVDSAAVLSLYNTELYFHDNAQIVVRGSLLASGCLFRGDRLDHMFDYLPYDRISGQWCGIRLLKSSLGNMFTNCEIRNTQDAILADSTNLQMVNCIIHNCEGYGIEGRNSDILLDYCQISNCLSDCLLADGGIVSVNHTTLAQFYPFSANRGAALRFSTGNRGVQFVGQRILVTGYEADVVFGEQNDTTLVYDFHFEDCLLRTDSVSDAERFKNIIWETPKDSVEGKKHFRTFDENNLYYDFTIDSISPAFSRNIGRIIQ